MSENYKKFFLKGLCKYNLNLILIQYNFYIFALNIGNNNTIIVTITVTLLVIQQCWIKCYFELKQVTLIFF